LNVEGLVSEVLLRHPAITAVRLSGSRATGTAGALSDWDFEVETSDFERVRDDLPELAATLAPLAQFWDPYSERANYILLLRGPVKVDLIFRDQSWTRAGPWEVSAETLPLIDQHFWDWTLWLAAKHRAGKDELVTTELAKMQSMLLEPLGVATAPSTLEGAIAAYRQQRDQRETELGLRLPRELGLQVIRRLSEEGLEV
jgi:hypothetical protein